MHAANAENATMPETIRALITGLIDYAGLFPPAKLDMGPATQNYARDLMGKYNYALGRFICPVSRLDELEKVGAMVMPGTFATSGYTEMADIADPWAISAVIDHDLEPCLDRIDAFNAKHEDPANGRAKIDAIELRVSDPHDIDEALDEIPEDITPAFEFPKEVVMGGDPRGYIAALAGNASTAKIRCGGVTHDLFPTPDQLANFITTCAQASVPFKATAGLHHPIRDDYNLTYEPDAPRGTMHGFVNVFIGAAMLRAGAIEPNMLTTLLEENNPAAFSFTDDAVTWNNHTLELAQLIRARESFCLGYGSCSFEEPIADLKALKLL